VTVAAESPLKSGLTTRILRGRDLEMLPNTPGGLRAALRALAVRSGGPRGPQIIVDGFAGGRLPPKESIREIRINDNPFSAEYSEMGLARIEIFTKPGTEKFHVNGFFNFNDESLNSRNPFSLDRTPFQSRLFGGNFSGPIIPKRGSFFFDFERQEIDDNALINATILDPSFNIISFNRSLVVPERRMTFSPRFDFQLNQKNTLVGRYSYTRKQALGEKIGDFSLPERGINAFDREHILQLTETAIIGTEIINETRFQFGSRSNRRLGNNSLPIINVADAFIGGGSDFDLMLRDEKFWELQNYTTLTRGNHDLKFGGKFRWAQLGEYSSENFNGTFTFSGKIAPQIDSRGQAIIDPATGRPLLTSITGIEGYRRTLFLRGLGLSLEDIRALGGGATQFSIAAGEPEESVSQSEVGVFVQDDWRLRPNFTFSAGLRLEAQNNIGRNLSFAPRLSFAWAPDGKNSDPKTIVRGGFGLFLTGSAKITHWKHSALMA
jgi:outer membrane receptor protein involved in Fe transport